MGMAKDIKAAVREICSAFPEVVELPPWLGLTEFKVARRAFAMLAINHKGDGRTALWTAAPPGAQEHFVASEPAHYFVPPYVGAKGWLGAHLDRGNDWATIAGHAQDGYTQVAPAALRRRLGEPPRIEPPTQTVDPEHFDPLSAPHAQAALTRLRAWCAKLPETSEALRYATPAFKAGKRTFLTVHRHHHRLTLRAWVGVERQAMLCDDPRFTIPGHLGRHGWIDLDVEEHLDFGEVRRLALGSYRHFARKRMLRALGADRRQGSAPA